MTSRQCIALLCLAVLCLAFLTPHFLLAGVLPVCFVFSLAIMVSSAVETEREPLLSELSLVLPARAPPALS